MKNTAHKLVALALASTASLMAQTVSAPPAGESEKPLILDTFTVNTQKDNGYLAVDSLAGGRQNSPIRVTPASMSSLTSQFISDLKITNVQDALKWSLSTVPTAFRGGFNGGTGGDVFNYWSISTRGSESVQGGNPPTKNYFPIFVIVDTYNVDRIEFDQGPNSILFGVGDIGGAISSYTKQPRFDKNFQNVDLLWTSYGGYRGTVDVNQSIGDLAVRFNAVAADEKGFRDGDFNKKTAADLALDWRFNSGNSHLRAEIEGWKQKKAIYAASYFDRTSLWNKSTVANTWGQAIAGAGDNPLTSPGAPGVQGMSDWGLNPYPVFIAGQNKIMDWSQGIRSMGTQSVSGGYVLHPSSYSAGGVNIMALPSKDFAVAPADGYVKPEQMNLTLTYDQRINSNFDAEVAAYYYVDDQYAINYEGGNEANYDLNKQLPDGTANPNFGQIYSDFFLDKQVQNHWVKELRGQLSYHFDAKPFNIPLQQVFSVSAGQQETEYDARQYNAQNISTDSTGWNGDNWLSKLVWGRVYWNQPQAAFNPPANLVRYQPLPFNWYDFDSKQTIKYGAFYTQSRLWDDRLAITGGIRRDKYDVSKLGLRGTGNTAVVASDAGNTYSIGAIGYVTEWLGILANKSENFQPLAGGVDRSLYGDVRGPSFGKGENYGLRVSTKDHTYYAQLTYYKSTASDVIGGHHPDFQGIWSNYIQAGGTKRDIGPAGQIVGSGAQMQYNTIYDVEYKGTELEIVANPTKNVRLQIHYAAPKGKRTNDGLEGVRYYSQHAADWKAVASATGTAIQQTLYNQLVQAEKDMATWAVPTLSAGVVKSMWNAWGTYTFDEDVLKGLDIGFGATEIGARQIDQTHRTTAYTTYSTALGYSKKFNALGRRLNTRFQLNVDNLFGKDTLIIQNFDNQDFNFVPPRKFTLSASFEF